jgi:hypothetical protein
MFPARRHGGQGSLPSAVHGTFVQFPKTHSLMRALETARYFCSTDAAPDGWGTISVTPPQTAWMTPPLTGGRKKAIPGGTMTRARSADDFGTIRARMEELRRERDGLSVAKDTLSVDKPPRYDTADRPIKAIKPGIPGWRVSSRKRFPTS